MPLALGKTAMTAAAAKKKKPPVFTEQWITPAEKRAMIAKAKAVYAAATTDAERQKAIGMPYSPWRSRMPLAERRELREFWNKPVDVKACARQVARMKKASAAISRGRVFSDSAVIIRELRDSDYR